MSGFWILRKIRGFGLLAFAGALCLSFQAGAAEYTLGVQDRVKVYVSEWPALSTEVAVGPGGQVSLPVVGEVPAKGLTTSQLAAAIAERLKQKANLPHLVDTSVDIVAYRPFYILGSVATPGEYAYRPGMLVLNAMSLAGGIYRNERGSEWEIERVSISSRGELAVLSGRGIDLDAERVRLQA
ncbi:polysaccharide biosynthesis/export family protein, partial [Rhizobiaceae sp. 2RAB30]